MTTPHSPATLGRDICGDWDAACRREWLVTNGLGGYACGTVAGANTRRYHGFLMASRKPPVERTLLVAKIDLQVDYLGACHELASNEFADGTVSPRGFELLESFRLEGGIPVWRFALADGLLEQRIFMAPGRNCSYLQLSVLRAQAPLTVRCKPLMTCRDYHSQGRGKQPLRAVGGGNACTVLSADGTPLCVLSISAGAFIHEEIDYWNFLHREERNRGLDSIEDLWGPGTFTARLHVGESLFLTASAGTGAPVTATAAPASTSTSPLPPPPAPADDILLALRTRAERLIAALPPAAPAWVRQLALAADQFIVRRGIAQTASSSVIAGYPWFADWGRDTMIALPGLTTVLGRHADTASILRTFASVLSRGMLPNRFPDAGETLEYNTADATLWWFQAISEHLAACADQPLLEELFPLLTESIHMHVIGTRFGIKVDAEDGLLRAGQAGSQLTWMDARQGDRSFTPRIGKPVEINALWLNALDVAGRLAVRLGDTVRQRDFEELRNRASLSFARFWNAASGCLHDVLDVDGGSANDPSIRPNQLFAVSLPLCVLPPAQQRAVVDTCARELLTSYGLRSLSAGAPGYIGHYDGDAARRDAAYHQGTVWSWLSGPFARAHYRVYGDAKRAQAFLEPFAQHQGAACLGQISEIFDGDPPHTARGCFAQAWSVAEILRSWVYLERQTAKN